MSSEITKNEVTDLLEYMERIEDHNKISLVHISALHHFMWAFLFGFAGLLDYLFGLTSFHLISILTWFVTSIFGGVYSVMLASRFVGGREITSASRTYRRITKLVYIVIIVTWIITILIGFLGYSQYIMVSIPFTIGSVNMILLISQTEFMKGSTLSQKIMNSIFKKPPISLSYLAGVINIVGLSVFGIEYSLYSGLVVGVFVGLGFYLTGRVNYKELQRVTKIISDK